MKKLLFHILILAILLLALQGCQPNIPVSTNPKDSDFSAFHPEVVSGDGFTIQPDVRVFTVYAYLNGVAGWENENGESFSPQRQALREALQDRLSKVDQNKLGSWRKFYDQHKMIPFSYLYYTMTLGAPPEFNMIVPVSETKRSGVIRSLNGFNKILSEFYTEAGLQELFETQFREMMMEDVRAYDAPSISADVDRVYQYVRLDRQKVETFDLVIVPNPFDTHYSAMSIGFQKRLYIVDGPGSNDRGLNVHEYMHMLMGEIMPKDLAGQKSKYSAMLKQNINGSYVKGNYEEAGIFVEEALVRALDYRIREKQHPDFAMRARSIIKEDVNGGLVLVDDFYQALEAYEKDSTVSLQDFVAQTLQAIPAEQ